MSKSITVKKAKDALQNLRKLSPANEKLDDDLEISIKEAISFMAPDLIQMTKRGFTSKELSDALTVQGITIKPATLNRYLNEHQAAKKDSEKSDPTPKTDDAREEKPEPDDQVDASGRANHQSGPPEHQPNEAPENPKSAPENLNQATENPNPGSVTADGKSDYPASYQNQIASQPHQASRG